MRVIAGRLGGRNLKTSDSYRPTTDREHCLISFKMKLKTLSLLMPSQEAAQLASKRSVAELLVCILLIRAGRP
jgi:16S rRNA G966 N2-methylase RsmD